MISVLAQRAPADKQGPDITDNLITSDSVAVERGRNEIDRNCSNRELVTGGGPLHGFIPPGTLVEVMDFEAGPWRGMVTGFSLSITRGETDFSADTNLVVERQA